MTEARPWFRVYRRILHSPKVQALKPDLFKAWVNLLCTTNDAGELPPLKELSFLTRTPGATVLKWIAELAKAGMLEDRDGVIAAHDWDEHQHKSDTDPTAASRKRKQRDRQRDSHAHVTRDIDRDSHGGVTRTDTDTDTDTEAETDTEQKERAATPTAEPSPPGPLDFKKELWSRGVLFLKGHGVEERDARSVIGRWRKSHGDLEVLNALASAEGASVSDPIPYVTAVLAGKTKPNGRDARQPRASAADVFGEFYRDGLEERAARG